MGEVVKLQKSGENLVITIPISVCEHLNLKDCEEVEMEPFICSGETGVRIKPKELSDHNYSLPLIVNPLLSEVSFGKIRQLTYGLFFILT